MRIGYPCINRSLPCRGNRTFKLASYSEARLAETVAGNLACLGEMLAFNDAHNLRYFRITSDLVPLASHPVCRFDWAGRFRAEFAALGRQVRDGGFRITMHPDQFTLLNSPDRDIFCRSVKELEYHARVLDAMGLDTAARIQIHVGGVYGDRAGSLRRFAARFRELPEEVQRRLTVENDERLYPLADCLALSGETGLPVLFDAFHHAILSRGESLPDALAAAGRTWRQADGPPLVDYSSQKPGQRAGTHADSLDEDDFTRFLRESRPHDFDLMLEIKDKEQSALRAVALAAGDPRLEPGTPDGSSRAYSRRGAEGAEGGSG
jgi:UV DNA damage endonuclease